MNRLREFAKSLLLELGIIKPPRHTAMERMMMQVTRTAVRHHARQQARAVLDRSFFEGEQWTAKAGKTLTVRVPQSYKRGELHD